MKVNDITAVVIGAAIHVHTQLGPGLLESVYEAVLAYEIGRRGCDVRRQVPIPVVYEGLRFEEGYRADLIVNDAVVVELKSVESLLPTHAKQVLTQLRLSRHRVGLLINFGEAHLKNGIKRFVNGYVE